MEQNIIEGNKKIAEFMGAEWKKDDYGDFGFFFKDKRSCLAEALKYHSSWDWLMPVVDKIKQTKSFHWINEGNQIEMYSYGKLITRVWSNDFKEAIYVSVLKYIDWYNTNK